MKIFISQGLKGKEQDQINYERQCITTYVYSMHNDATFNELLQLDFVKSHNSVECLGRSIMELGKCDKIYIPNDYMNYKGCIVEHYIAKFYGIPMEYYDIDDICYGTADDYKKFIKGE